MKQLRAVEKSKVDKASMVMDVFRSGSKELGIENENDILDTQIGFCHSHVIVFCC